MNFGSAFDLVQEAPSPTDLLMSLNLSRNAVAMEKALSFLADAERSIDDCASCLARDVIVSEAQAAEHNRSIVDARNALHALRGQLQSEHGEVCRHLRDAQMVFIQSKPLITLATGSLKVKAISRGSLTSRDLPMKRMRIKMSGSVTRQRMDLRKYNSLVSLRHQQHS